MTRRKLAPEEAALWARVIANVTPLKPTRPELRKPLPFRGGVGAGNEVEVLAEPPPSGQPIKKLGRVPPLRPHPNPSPKGEGLSAQPRNTLDSTWDRRLSRGQVAPESSIDLHGHNLDSAYHLLDQGLARAIARGDRVLLLITGKPPRPESERPHSRGAIRAAVGDWLASSRHADRIAAVRGAHPNHGGSGALYIVLRRQRTAGSRNS